MLTCQTHIGIPLRSDIQHLHATVVDLETLKPQNNPTQRLRSFSQLTGIGKVTKLPRSYAGFENSNSYNTHNECEEASAQYFFTLRKSDTTTARVLSQSMAAHKTNQNAIFGAGTRRFLHPPSRLPLGSRDRSPSVRHLKNKKKKRSHWTRDRSLQYLAID